MADEPPIHSDDIHPDSVVGEMLAHRRRQGMEPPFDSLCQSPKVDRERDPFDPCSWCRRPADDPGSNDRGMCPCACHEGVPGWVPWAERQ